MDSRDEVGVCVEGQVARPIDIGSGEHGEWKNQG